MSVDTEHQRSIVIVGLGAAGLHVSKAALSQDRRCRVTFIEERDFDQFSPCALPFAVEGVIEDMDRLKHSLPEMKNRLSKYLAHSAVSLDPGANVLTVRERQTGEERAIPYDALVLATGAEPVMLPVPGVAELAGKGIHVVSDIESASALKTAAKSNASRSAVVVGAGAIGLETAHALVSLGLSVTVVEAENRPLPRTIDPEMAGAVLDQMKALGITPVFGRPIGRVLGSDRVEGVRVGDETIPCDILVMAVGRGPRSGLAIRAGAAQDRGFIVVDNRMETTLKNVYAVGDIARTFSRIDRSPAVMQLATAAYKQGTVAGINAAGGNASYPGVLNTFVTAVGPLYVGGTGYTLETALRLGYRAKAVTLSAETKSHYMPGGVPVTLRAVLEEGTGRILGAQALGTEGVAWRINVFAAALHGRMTVYDLADAELAYYPAVSQMVDPVSQLAEIAIKRLKLPAGKCGEVFRPGYDPDDKTRRPE
jgi:NADH oxidase (H2O2-forming)